MGSKQTGSGRAPNPATARHSNFLALRGQEGLAAEVQRQRLLAQVQAWQSLDDSLQDLARQLDALSEERGGSGHVRIRLWEREQGLGL